MRNRETPVASPPGKNLFRRLPRAEERRATSRIYKEDGSRAAENKNGPRKPPAPTTRPENLTSETPRRD